MCVCVCVCTCMCILHRGGNQVFASRAVVVVQMTASLTGYSDCLTSFREPLLLPCSCSCHTGLKNV